MADMSSATLTTDHVKDEGFISDNDGAHTRQESSQEYRHDDEPNHTEEDSVPMKTFDQKSIQDEEEQDDSRPKRSRFQITMIMVAMCVSNAS
jgi:hypothetical protein